MKNVLKILLSGVAISLIYYIWMIEYNFNFKTITENKVYKSGLIDPNKLGYYLEENKINTVINLLNPHIQDNLNPAFINDILLEDEAILAYNKKYDKKVKHIRIPSLQVPTKETLVKFFEALDDISNYPVLIHCYHGTGRAQIYSALYRIEYEQWSNEEARSHTRFILEGLGYRSSFAKGKGKGDFLINYKPRLMGEESTMNRLSK
ncbi:MAG: dual specificity protein phosphatase family protein [Sulfurovum sp.]|nr:dual specificity protein phosphatase family protein [Sulfurovum sp.]